VGVGEWVWGRGVEGFHVMQSKVTGHTQVTTGGRAGGRCKSARGEGVSLDTQVAKPPRQHVSRERHVTRRAGGGDETAGGGLWCTSPAPQGASQGAAVRHLFCGITYVRDVVYCPRPLNMTRALTGRFTTSAALQNTLRGGTDGTHLSWLRSAPEQTDKHTQPRPGPPFSVFVRGF
jgi:hypothetical protein